MRRIPADPAYQRSAGPRPASCAGPALSGFTVILVPVAVGWQALPATRRHRRAAESEAKAHWQASICKHATGSDRDSSELRPPLPRPSESVLGRNSQLEIQLKVPSPTQSLAAFLSLAVSR